MSNLINLRLNADVLITILSFCSISSVITASQTCKRMHSLAFNKTVWVSLVRYLESRTFVDRLPGRDIKELSTSELIDLVKRAVQGPESWSPPYSHTVSRQHILHPKIPAIMGREVAVELLPGGRCFVLSGHGCLLVWSVLDDELIWKYVGQPSSTYFAATHALDDETCLLFIVEQLSHPADLRHDCLLNIVRLNLITGASHSLFNTQYYTDGLGLDSLDICGDYAVAVAHRTRRILLVDWKTQSCILFDPFSPVLGPNYGTPHVRLTCNHLILLTQTPLNVPTLSVWDINLFSDLWSSKDARRDWYSGYIGDIPFTASVTSHHPSLSQRGWMFAELSLHESVLDEDFYTVTAVFKYPRTERAESLMSTMITYSLSVSEPRLSSSSSQPLRDVSLGLKSQRVWFETKDDSRPADYVSSTGHTMVIRNEAGSRRQVQILNLRHSTGARDDGILVLTEDMNEALSWQLCAYGGSMIFLVDESTVVVKYYQ